MIREVPEISVALVTRNGPERLDGCLFSVRSQSCQPYEIVVSDDSDEGWTASTRRVAERHRCRYVAGPKRGLYANRNHAASLCTGTHIRTMDDDHRFPSGHFERCYDAVLSDADAIWTTGETGFVDGVFVNEASLANQLHPSGFGCSPTNVDNNWSIADGSTIYPARVFKDGYRMLECFTYGSSYLEFGAYLFHRGFKSRCLRGASVEHYATSETLNRLHRYDYLGSLSIAYAVVAYNFHFRRNLPRGVYYLMRVVATSGFDRKLIQAIPGLLGDVRKRWRPGRKSAHGS